MACCGHLLNLWLTVIDHHNCHQGLLTVFGNYSASFANMNWDFQWWINTNCQEIKIFNTELVSCRLCHCAQMSSARPGQHKSPCTANAWNRSWRHKKPAQLGSWENGEKSGLDLVILNLDYNDNYCYKVRFSWESSYENNIYIYIYLVYRSVVLIFSIGLWMLLTHPPWIPFMRILPYNTAAEQVFIHAGCS